MVYLKLARIVLRDSPATSNALILSGARHRDLDGWIDQARMFYTNALKSPDVLAQLEQINIIQAALENGLAEIGMLEGLRLTQGYEVTDARAARTKLIAC